MSQRKVTIIAKPPPALEGGSPTPIVHWAVVVGNGEWTDPDIFIEILPVRGGPSPVKPKMGLRALKRGEILGKYITHFHSLKEKGTTTLSDEKLVDIARGIVAENPVYNLLTHNCQHFAGRLAREIIEQKEEVVDPVPYTMDLEKHQAQIDAFTDLLHSQGLPNALVMLHTWVIDAYDDGFGGFEFVEY